MLARGVKRAHRGTRPHPAATAQLRRTLSSSSPTLSPPSPSPAPATTAQLVQDLRTLLGRYPLIDPAWNSRLERTLADLRHTRQARVAIVGDRESGAQGVVTALLDDPLASNPDVTVALEGRRLRADAPEAVVLKYGEEGRSSSSEVELPAGWLKENKAEVVEIVHGDGIPPLESSFSTLHLSDAVVLVVSDSTLLSSKAAQTLLYNLHSKPNLFLALNAPDASSPSSSSPLRTLQHQLSTLFPSTSSSPAVDEQQPQTLLISTSQALAALEALSPSDPTTPPSFESFQKNYVSSQLPTLSSALSAALAPHSSATSSPLQEQTALYLLSTTLHRSAFAGAQIGDSLASASSSLSALAQQADESSLTLLTSLGVDPSSGLLRIPPADLEAAMAALEDTLQTRLAWYKLPYRADDLPAELALVVSQTFLPEFERQLTYSAGAATALQRELSARVDALLASPAWAEPQSAAPAARLASLYSPVMRNRVAQAEVEAQQGATATSLSAALTRRRDQLTAPGGPVEALQRRAQAAVFSSGVLSLSSVVGAAGASVAEYAELATAGGWGLMGVTFAAWLGQNRWEKAKRRFRKDVGERVKGGIEEDLGLAARRLSQRALYKTRTTVALGEELIRQKQDGFEAFRAELAAIEARRKELEAAKKQ